MSESYCGCPDEFRCICDPADVFDPPDPTPRAVEGCPAHRARRAYQQWAAEQPEPATGGVVNPAAFAEPEPGCTLTFPPRPADSAAAKLRSLYAQPHGGGCTCRECDERAADDAHMRAMEERMEHEAEQPEGSDR